MRAQEIAVFIACFAVITVVGLLAGRWRKADLSRLEEWGLAGRTFGTFVTWFLQGGSIYTTYAFVAVPAHIYGEGGIGWYSIPYAVIFFAVTYLVWPRLWAESRANGHVTVADYAQHRFSSPAIGTIVAIVGLVATMPYLALQLYGMQICFALVGLPPDEALWAAFGVLAVVTYASGLRSAALISIFKDLFIWGTVILAVVVIPLQLGGIEAVMARVPLEKMLIRPDQYVDFGTLVLGSALALSLYPHLVTGAFAAKESRVIRRNAVILPIYSVMLAGLAFLAYAAIAAGIEPSAAYGTNSIVPELFDRQLPPALAGFALAAIAIGGMVPAGVMAIASGNLFARNLYVPLLHPEATPERIASVSKLVSTVVKVGAALFIIAVPTTYIVHFQLAAGVWILQTAPAVALSLFVRGLDRRAVLAGLCVGLASGTAFLVATGFTAHSLRVGSEEAGVEIYAGLVALAINAAIVVLGSLAARRSPEPAGARSA